jgi:type IV pilus assembly protein PilQ
MINIKNLGTILLVLLIQQQCWCQNEFENRLTEIKTHLDMLSDSVAPGLRETATLSVSNSPIQSFLRTIAEGHNLNIQIDPSLNIMLSNNFTNVQVKDLLYFLCREYRLDIRFISSILSFYQYQNPIHPVLPPARKKINVDYDTSTGKISYDLSRDTLSTFLKRVTELTNRNVITSGGADIENKLVHGYIKDLPLENALDKLAFINGLKFAKAKDGVFVFENLQTNQLNGGNNNATQLKRFSQGDITVRDSLIDLDVVNLPILDIVNQVSSQLNKNFFIFSEITGNTSARVRGVKYDDLLSILFQGTTFTYKKRNSVYLIGQRVLEGFRTTELYKLDFRPIEGIEKELPAELLKDVDIKIARELNSMILTGNKHKIDELLRFVRLIDQPIPNILIEVIVAEAKKGFSLQTGLKAFLSDSIPKTQGQIFPGLDLTLSTRSVNSALEDLDSKGIVNLGRVSPKFYMTLQAMEKNNNLQLRSTPKLSTINGSKANLTIGQSVYYVEQTQNITGGVNPITTTVQRFNKVEANLAISISPVVSGDEHVTLDILAEFSNFVPSTIANAPPGNTTRKFESKIRMKNEEMIILGGLEELSKSETGSGVPLLSRIPILKWLFSSKSKDNSDNRLIVFIKPTIVY